MGKWPIFDQNHGLTPLEKSQFSGVFELLFFYSLKRRFFVLEYRKIHFSWPILPERKRWKNGQFLTKTMD